MEEKDRWQTLLKEYELCQDHTKHIENNIWATSSIIGLGSMTSLLLSNLKDIDRFSVVLIGVFLVIAVWIWWGAAKRWWDIQHATFMRMRHIEEEIHLYQMRYIEYFNEPVGKRRNEILKGLKDERIKFLSEQFPDFHEKGVQSNLKWLPLLIRVIWGLYILVILLK